MGSLTYALTPTCPPVSCPLLAPTTRTHPAPPPESIEQERSSPDAFSQQPYYYMELACLLLEHAKGCFASNEEYMQVRVGVCVHETSMSGNVCCHQWG